jgi:ribosomal peptide maturation radical SAM protein 1
MPFVSATRPSIQLGLLKAIADANGHPTQTYHLNLPFAKAVGIDVYEVLCRHRGRLIGDWLFSQEAFGCNAPDSGERFLDDFASDVKALFSPDVDSPGLLRYIRREIVPKYLDALIEGTRWVEYDVIGFTSTFQQNAATIAMARRLKGRWPHLIIVAGGANFESQMGLELTRAIECIDYSFIGEADEAWPEFLRSLAVGRDPAEVQGVACMREGGVSFKPREAPFTAMNDLPVPDYDEFFKRAEVVGLLEKAGRRHVQIPFESSRGCWWGEHRHCTFCGLNGSTMTHRSKDPQRVAQELATLAGRHRSFWFEAVDNIIPIPFISELFEYLITIRADYDIFYEVKANLERDQVRTLRLGGVRRIQPGIESLSTRVLQLMRKGTTAIQNVNLLRWSLYYDLDVSWNMLWGFPGETPEDYAAQLSLLRLIVHLQPPAAGGRIWMERFSPIYIDRSAFPTDFIRPESSYSYVYPGYLDLDKVAYFFDYRFTDNLPDHCYHTTTEQIEHWQSLWKAEKRPRLTYRYAPGLLQIDDNRDGEREGIHTFRSPLAEMYIACSDRPRTPRRVKQELQLNHAESEISAALDEFTNRGLMMDESNRYLALAVPATKTR